jgi:hypothetical protein
MLSSSFFHSWRFSLNLFLLGPAKSGLPPITLSSLSLPKGDYKIGAMSGLSN